jgi:hypothetical protein
VDGEKSHEKPSLGKRCSYLYQNLSTVVVGNHLHEKSPSAQEGTHQKSQGKTGNHQENKALGHPCFFEKYE